MSFTRDTVEAAQLRSQAVGAGIPDTIRCQMFAATCAFRRPASFAELRRDRPDLFHRACDLEDLLNTRRRQLGKGPVWPTRFNRPLREAIPEAQDMLPGFGPATDDLFAGAAEDALSGVEDAVCDNGCASHDHPAATATTARAGTCGDPMPLPIRQPGPKLADVARHAGVSVGTVSGVLNGRDSVADATRVKVATAIADLGYLPTSLMVMNGG